MDVADSENRNSKLALVQFLSAGTLLQDKLSWWFHKHIYDIEGDKNSGFFDPDKLISLNNGQPHEAWLQYNHSTGMNFRAGIFELPLWFSPVKTKVGESDYLIYGATGNPDMTGTLASPQFGIALNGFLKTSSTDDDWYDDSEENYAVGYNYAISMTNGQAEFPQNSHLGFNTFYGRITKKDPIYAAGLWVLAGKVETTSENDHDQDNHHTEENVKSNSYFHLGADIDLFIRGDDVNLYSSFIFGNDIDRDFVGGLIGYDHLILPKLFGLVRLDGVYFLNGSTVSESDDGHGDDHGEEEDHAEGGGHAHGVMIMDDASSISTGIYFLPFNNVRFGLEYVYQLNGNIGKEIHGKGGNGIFQIQFGL